MKSMNKAMILIIILQRVIYADSFFSKLIPDHIVTQFAGNQGIISSGIGYSHELFKRETNTKIMYGFMPESIAGTDIHIFCLKRSTCINEYKLGALSVKTSLKLSVLLSITENTYISWPEHFPEGYYFPNAFHLQPSLGFSFNFNPSSNINLNNVWIYTDLGILDMHLYHSIKTDRINILGNINLSLGLVYYLQDLYSGDDV